VALETKKMWLEPEHSELSIRQQCSLLSINRSSLYYRPVGIDAYTLLLMHELDKQYTETPFYGVLKMTEHLRFIGHQVNVKRVRRLLRKMGLETVYPKPKLSQANPEHKVFPYLLRTLPIERCNQVWSTDITYIRLKHGFVYLMAIIDWYSRYVLKWALSTTLEADFCIIALNEALETSQCEIFNTDQGSQFTTHRFTQPLLDKGIRVSMDGRGRALDNIFVERLWRSVKYEKVYLNDFQTVNQAYQGLKDYFEFYNHRRLHQSLDYQTPAEVYLKKVVIDL
jgi:putative transposase